MGLACSKHCRLQQPRVSVKLDFRYETLKKQIKVNSFFYKLKTGCSKKNIEIFFFEKILLNNTKTNLVPLIGLYCRCGPPYVCLLVKMASKTVTRSINYSLGTCKFEMVCANGKRVKKLYQKINLKY